MSTSVLQYSTEGSTFGKVSLYDLGQSSGEKSRDVSQSVIRMSSVCATGEPTILDLKVENIALCVVPMNNRDDVEIQFAEKETKREASLVQITFHFPPGEDEEGITQAEQFQQQIKDTGVLRSVTGDIITEFSKEQGNFVTPRGKYTIQMTSTYFHMQGAQYAYKIQYEDVNCMYLLPKLDGGRVAFVISLDKPIRQGSQKYQHLVIETHKVECTQTINLSEEEIQSKYDGQLSEYMTKPLSALIATIFKVLTNKKVFQPKQYVSSRDAHCVRCSIKASDGLLYPLAKSFIFINKPTVIIAYEDIEFIEFKRYEPVANSASRSFDMVVTVRAAAAERDKEKDREYTFISIDRSEYGPLFDYLSTKEINIKNPQTAFAGAAVDAQMDSDDDGSEEDGDYEAKSAGSGSGSGSGSDDEDSEDGSDGEKGSGSDDDKDRQKSGKEKGKSTAKAAPKSSKPSATPAAAKRGKKDAGEAEGQKKQRQKKDKNAPKGALSAYILFTKEERNQILKETPGLGATDVMKEAANRWKSLSAQQKERFEEMAKGDKERYNQDMAKYKASAKEVSIKNPQVDSDDGGSEEGGDSDAKSVGSGDDEDDEDGSGSDDDKDRQKSGKETSKSTAKAAPKSSKPSAAAKRGRKDAGEAEGQKKKRQKKDKNAPKGALSAYILFTKEERNQILKETPGLGATDVMKEAANRWKSLNAQQKERFEEMAKSDKERYNQDMAKYKATQSDD